MTEDTAAPQPVDVALAAETLGKDLLSAIVDELNATEWALKPPGDQELAISRLRVKCSSLIAQGLEVMFAGGYPACEAVIDSVTVKKGLKVGVRIAKGTRNWPDVVEAEGQKVLIVMADPEVYRQNMAEVRARANQGDLFNGNYKGTTEFRRDEPAEPIEGKTWADVSGNEEDDSESITAKTHTALTAVHCAVPPENVDKWSIPECACAYEWAVAYLADPETPLKRPWWLPMPTPPQADDEETEGATDPESEEAA